MSTDTDEIVKRLSSLAQKHQWDSNFPGFRRIYAESPFGNRVEFLRPQLAFLRPQLQFLRPQLAFLRPQLEFLRPQLQLL